MDPFVGEVRIFFGNFAPRGWALCEGQILSIAQNTALFSLLGTNYGGNGQTTFALPDLQGRIPLHAAGQDSVGEQTRMSTFREFDSQSSTSFRDLEPELPKKKAKKKSAVKTDESPETLDPSARAVEELQRLVDTLNESREQTQRMIELQGEIVNRVQGADALAREFQDKSKEGEYSDAGSSLKALLAAIEALNQDPNALPALESFVEKLSESQQQVSEAVQFQKAIVDQIKTAALNVIEYRTMLGRGKLSDAGALLQQLLQLVNELGESWDPNRASSPDATRIEEHTPSTAQWKQGANARFVTAYFMIALHGVFPPRN